MPSYLGMYDITCSRRRRFIFRILSAYGIHQQQSVFECHLQYDMKKQLLQHLDSLMPVEEGEISRILLIKIYPQHPECILLGAAKHLPASDCLYIG